MPVYRYQWIGISDPRLQQLVPGNPVVSGETLMFWDCTAPASSKDDLDEVMLELGFEFSSTDPVIPPTEAAHSLMLTAGEDLVEGNLVTISTSATAIKASATTSLDRFRVVGVVLEDALNGTPVSVATAGQMAKMIFVGTAPLAGHNGRDLYLSTTNGVATLAANYADGTTNFKVGVLTGGDGVTLLPEAIFLPQYNFGNP